MKSGFVSLVGRPNAGKSTLLNRIVGQKLAIVSDKPQTTRTRIIGVKQYPDAQAVFVDTPGIHKPTHRLNVRMVDTALEAMRGVVRPGPGDSYMLDLVGKTGVPTLLALSKVDLVAKPRLLPLLERYQKGHAFADFVPVSAADGTNVEALEQAIIAWRGVRPSASTPSIWSSRRSWRAASSPRRCPSTSW